MLENKKFNAINLIQSLSETLELSNPGIFKHHLDVAFISHTLANEIGLSEDRIPNLVYAALIHDIGAAIEWNEKQQMIINDDDSEIFKHAFEGYEILKESKFFYPIADIVQSHHNRYLGPNPNGLIREEIPIESRIIYLADRIDLAINFQMNYFNQIEHIVHTITTSNHFDPKCLEAFKKISMDEEFWLELVNIDKDTSFTDDFKSHHPFEYSIEDLISIAEIFSKLVDAKSAFTARHSQNVAKVAEFMAQKSGLDEIEVKHFYLAGLLHDLGKLVVPTEIIDKEGPLTDQEYDLIKRHSYYSEFVIKKVEGFEEIAQWLGEHHERLDGSGYPKELKGQEISFKSRILQISDVFSALTEHRPYRPSLSNNEVLSQIQIMTDDHQLDKDLMKLLETNFVQLRQLIDVDLVNPELKKNDFYYDS